MKFLSVYLWFWRHVDLLCVSQYGKKEPQIVKALEKIMKYKLEWKLLILNLFLSNDV
jgi:hypothetical protein